MDDVMAAVGAVAFWQLLMFAALIWQSIRTTLLKRRLRRSEAVVASHQRALISMHIAGMISDDDWDRATTPLPRKRHRPTITIEPVRNVGMPTVYTAPPTPPRDLPYPPKRGPRGGAGNSGIDYDPFGGKHR
jgi:hypothetical protein